MSETQNQRGARDGCVSVLVFLGAFAGASMFSMLIGPVTAPRALPVFASALCPENTVSAAGIVQSSRARRGSSYSFALHCRSRDGSIERASATRVHVASWLLFNGLLVLGALASVRVYRALDRLVTGGRA